MPNVSLTAPTDYATELQAIERRRKLAELLAQQSMEPIQSAAPNAPISWTQGLAKILQGYNAGQGEKKADAEAKDLAARQQADQSGDVQRLIAALGGQQAKTIQPDPQEAQQSADQGTPQVAPVNIPAMNPQQSLQAALPEMRTPMGQQFAGTMLTKQAEAMIPKRPEPYTLKPGEVRYDETGSPVAFGQQEKPESPKPFGLAPGHTQYDAQGKPIVTAPDKSEGQMPVTPVDLVDEATGRVYKVDARTGRRLGLSPADTKLSGQYNADTATLQGSTSAMDRLAVAANQLLEHPGLAGITGLRGKIPNIPGSSAADAQALLDTLKSQVAFGVLQDMRNNSRTGGALGNVSDAEGKRLEANLAALANAQSTEAMQKSLKSIMTYTDQAKVRLQDAFNLKHGGAGGLPARPGQQSATPDRRQADRGGGTVVVNY